MSARERTVRVGDVELAVAEHGPRGATPVLLVHGYPDTSAVWRGVIARLAADHHVIAYDVRGAGRSSRPRGDAAYDLAVLADDLAAVIDAVSPGRPVHVVGHDWGSIAAWELCTTARADRRVASFTSISGPCLDHVGRWLGAARSPAAIAEQAARSWYIAALTAPGLAARVWPALAPRWPALLARLEGVRPEPAPTLADDGVAGAALYRRNVRARLRRPRDDAHARVPVQLIVPRRDRFVSAALVGEVARWAPALTVRHVDAGHWVPRTHPEAIARWVGEHAAAVEARVVRAPARVVLVTGAGRGIGRATALAFAEAGATVIAADLDGAAAERTALLASLVGPPATAVTVDVTDPAAMTALAATIAARHGAVDVVVNNAGVATAGGFLATGVDEWKRVLDVNLWGVIHGCRLFGRQMVDAGRRGHIVNIASAAAFQPSRALPAYATSKAAVLMLSECLRAELGPHGIGVTAVCPGLVATGITDAARFVGDGVDEGALRRRATRAYRRRGFEPDRVADAIVDAVTHDRAVVTVTPEAAALRWLARLAPRARQWLAGVDALGGGA